MKLSTNLTNLGITISLVTDDSSRPLEAASNADQKQPRRSYVYAHLDETGKIFYVGVGNGRRAWSTDRHALWHRYVQKHLYGKYQVRILTDNHSMEEAEELEAAWIAQHASGLVNVQNMGRPLNYEAGERYHKLREANRALIQQAKSYEKHDLARAVSSYSRAIEAIAGYASTNIETDLFGKLLEEEAEELGRSGEIEALDRLTMCLIKLGRSSEAARNVNSYFTMYRRDLNLGVSKRIIKRIEKALARIQK